MSATPAVAASGSRLERLGRGGISRKPEDGPAELTARHRLLVLYQIDGCPHADMLQRIKRPKAVIDETSGQPVIREVSVEPGEPLDLIEAADVLRIRRRNARQLTKTPAYQRFMAVELQAFREGERVRSIHTMVEVRDDPGLGKAADRKVRLAAAQALIGESDTSRGSTTVNVGIGITQQAGIVIIDPRNRPHPPAPSIEATDG